MVLSQPSAAEEASSGGLIVAADLNNQAADSPQLIPMVDLVRRNLGRNPQQISADAGYCSEANLKVLERRLLDPYIATGKRSRDRDLPPAPKGRIPAHLTIRQRMERKLLTKAGRAACRLRQQVVEPVFGQIKNKGLIRLLLRGEENCRANGSSTAPATTSASSRPPGDDRRRWNRPRDPSPPPENWHRIRDGTQIHRGAPFPSAVHAGRCAIAKRYSDGLLG